MIAIVDYGAGNLTSVRWALDELGYPSRISSDPAEIVRADRIIFPGVGAAGAAMRHLRDRGLIEILRGAVAAGVPFLGICLGMQILFERTEEDGGVETLGVLAGDVRRFQPSYARDKIPHMGWNLVRWLRPHPVLEGISPTVFYYFVHSYYACPGRPGLTLGAAEYAGVEFCAAAACGSVVATQFHIEKSGRPGLALLDRFARWDGRERPGPARPSEERIC